MVDLILRGAEHLGVLQADLLARRPRQPADRLQHGVEDGHGEVPLGVRQAGWIVCAGSLAQGQVPLTLQVRFVQVPLPRRAVLDEVPGTQGDQFGVLSDELLLPLGEP